MLVFFVGLGMTSTQAQNIQKKQPTAISNATPQDFLEYTTADDAVDLFISNGCIGYAVYELTKDGKQKELAKYQKVCLDGKSRSRTVNVCYPSTNKLIFKWKKVDAKATVEFRPTKNVCK